MEKPLEATPISLQVIRDSVATSGFYLSKHVNCCFKSVFLETFSDFESSRSLA